MVVRLFKIRFFDVFGLSRGRGRVSLDVRHPIQKAEMEVSDEAEHLPTKGADGWPDISVGGPWFCFPVERWSSNEYALTPSSQPACYIKNKNEETA